jgi:hypothetical protein
MTALYAAGIESGLSMKPGESPGDIPLARFIVLLDNTSRGHI